MLTNDNLRKGKNSSCSFPSKVGVANFAHNMSVNLFPILEGGGCHPYSKSKLRDCLVKLLVPIQDRFEISPEVVADSFFKEVPLIKKQLKEDAAFIALGDPAALDIDVVIMAYPGFFAILVYRLAHCLSGLGVPIVPRVMTEYAHSLTGIDINPKATIGSEFFIDHGTGIVIGETAVIGNKVKLYQGVTIGALSVNKT
ncbi:MAG: serine acetyltransferase, partial [Bacteroidales bacterium]|nr:serine acetyltransferase [Bacteroidales bacterium]